MPVCGIWNQPARAGQANRRAPKEHRDDVAEGVIVGSACVKTIEGSERPVETAKQFAAEFRSALSTSKVGWLWYNSFHHKSLQIVHSQIEVFQ